MYLFIIDFQVFLIFCFSIKPLQDLIKKKKDRKGNPAPQTPSK